ncbi:TetR/AcrR family transcriptional regulator [Pseudooceanicola sp. CBS1P-1]|uniref:TetR family transcriptional regulator n=1 Tax=Pseudooceanicola albus TaxID=2692189 RepID=A0A6L7G6Z5_9RHOB|nr:MULTISPECIES: TetR/AcrR family transcriptional regulator [Pseudooceanicola]MBT9384059.1 TetR/AcrR family transcriptional regulator [Pseudooceanicola endophyticus]MXN19841.1 TetR family transcriptional regulator [Pseudooceanicola albus]
MSRKPRLSPEDWLQAGLDALAVAGPEALKAEPLARALETTKGSFYWHFPDVPHFRQSLLEFWQGLAALPEEAPADRRAAVAQLHAIVKEGFSAGIESEAAIRAWARTEPEAARMLAEVDAARLQHLEALLRGVGVTNPDIARMLLAARVGMTSLCDSSGEDARAKNESALDTLVDLVLALR